MRIEKVVPITTTGVLTVSVAPVPPKGYVTTSFRIDVTWDAMGLGPFGGFIYWGDGSSEAWNGRMTKSASFYHTYASPGTYSIRVTVEDDGTGASGEGTTSVEVRTALAITFTADKTSGPIPLTVTFSGSISGGYTPYSWTLDYGDGATPDSGTATPISKSHVYSKVGTFTAKLTVTDALGATVLGRTRILAGIITWWELFKAWWESLTSAQKALFVLGGAGGVAGIVYALKK